MDAGQRFSRRALDDAITVSFVTGFAVGAFCVGAMWLLLSLLR